MCKYYVYMMANISRTLYTGVTSDLERRVFEHKKKLVPGFPSRYNINKLVWFDKLDGVMQAIEGEKKIKGWSRSKKIALIEENNPQWKDLAHDWLLAQRGSVGKILRSRSLPQNDTFLLCGRLLNFAPNLWRGYSSL